MHGLDVVLDHRVLLAQKGAWTGATRRLTQRSGQPFSERRRSDRGLEFALEGGGKAVVSRKVHALLTLSRSLTTAPHRSARSCREPRGHADVRAVHLIACRARPTVEDEALLGGTPSGAERVLLPQMPRLPAHCAVERLY